MLTQAKTYLPSHKIGIYSSQSQWGPILGDSYKADAWPIWYAAYNSHRDFTDFHHFNGWEEPAIHQYHGDATVCGIDMDLNVMKAKSLMAAAMEFSKANGGTKDQPHPDPNPQCTKAGGKCVDSTVDHCTGGHVTHGLCPNGHANLLCCVPPHAPPAPAPLAPPPASRTPKKVKPLHRKLRPELKPLRRNSFKSHADPNKPEFKNHSPSKDGESCGSTMRERKAINRKELTNPPAAAEAKKPEQKTGF